MVKGYTVNILILNPLEFLNGDNIEKVYFYNKTKSFESGKR